jgi:lysophospholipase L1-like esterase
VGSSRLRVLITGVAAIAVVTPALPAGSAAAADSHAREGAGQGWFGAWTSAQHHPIPGNQWDGPNWSVDGFANQSVRQVVRISAGGSYVRIRLSNRYGTKPLRVAGATIAKTGPGAAIQPGTPRPLTFGHRLSATIRPGAEATSDAALLSVSALESLSLTLYFAEPTGPATFHEGALTTTYRATGDRRFDPGTAAFAGETSHSWYYLTGVDVSGGPRRAKDTVVAFGDSITDGYGSTPDANNRYPDELAERLVAAGRPVGVVNAGINGNKLLANSPCYGEKGVSRFHRDVLGQPGVRTAIVLEGLNDIGAGGFPDFGCGTSPVLTAAQVIEAHRALIRTAHVHGVTIIGATLTPMKGAYGYDTPEKEAVRDAVNQWIRTSGEYDAVVDLDQALADPADPDALLPAYDFGDHLHPNDAGTKAIAAAINLNTL